jgi:BirA family transcriptional regulator, biotin operon repressor / biotin---[acetyl-CoA-carboxylase] ligase
VKGALPDLARAERLIAERGCALGSPLRVRGETTSTNDEAKHAAKAGAQHGSTWVAETQTAGRGRQGRTWVSPPGENLLVSVVWRGDCPPARLPLLSIATGVAVCDVARRFAPGADIRLKWPNDVVVVAGDKPRTLHKLAGVLVETSMTAGKPDAVVIGVGFNVLTRNWPDDIRPPPTSLSLLTQAPLDRAEILASLLQAIDRETTLVAARGLGLLRGKLDAWDALAGEPVESELGSGVAAGIDGEGRLVVRQSDGSTAAWSAGEVHLATRSASAP